MILCVCGGGGDLFEEGRFVEEIQNTLKSHSSAYLFNFETSRMQSSCKHVIVNAYLLQFRQFKEFLWVLSLRL